MLKCSSLKIVGVALFVLALQASAVAGSIDAGSFGLHGAPPQPSSNATGFRMLYRTAVFENTRRGEKTEGGGPPEPPTAPLPGDETTREWTECATATVCTRYNRTDRYQRTDAPISEGSNPNNGVGPFDWVPVRWGSSHCANYNACLGAQFGSFIGY